MGLLQKVNGDMYDTGNKRCEFRRQDSRFRSWAEHRWPTPPKREPGFKAEKSATFVLSLGLPFGHIAH